MLATRLTPFLANEWNRLQREMGGLLRHPWPALAQAFPLVNLWEDANNFYAEAELPGLAQDQVEIYVTEGNQLTLQGERKPAELPQGTWHRQERGFGKFSRVLTLPAPVDADKVEARLTNGVLFVTLPKSASARPRQITVKAE